MSLNNRRAQTGRINKNSVMNHVYLLAHQDEPADSYRSFSDDEVKEELYENRYFLKHRVWKNMAKIRRQNRESEQVFERGYHTLKPHTAK